MRLHTATLGVLALAIAVSAGADDSKEPPAETFDGLKRRDTSELALVYVKPGTDFSVYSRLLLEPARVAFRKGWKRDHTPTRGFGGVSERDIKRIKQRLAELFRDVFVEELEERGDYTVVDTAAEDVLQVRPAIIDLDITAPDVRLTSRSRTFVTSAGAATLFIELYDSLSGEILARAIDRKSAPDYGRFHYATTATNFAEAQRMLGQWAKVLRQRLDEVHGKTEDPERKK